MKGMRRMRRWNWKRKGKKKEKKKEKEKKKDKRGGEGGEGGEGIGGGERRNDCFNVFSARTDIIGKSLHKNTTHTPTSTRKQGLDILDIKGLHEQTKKYNIFSKGERPDGM